MRTQCCYAVNTIICRINHIITTSAQLQERDRFTIILGYKVCLLLIFCLWISKYSNKIMQQTKYFLKQQALKVMIQIPWELTRGKMYTRLSISNNLIQINYPVKKGEKYTIVKVCSLALYCSTRWHTNHTLIVYFTSWKYGIIKTV